MNITVLGAGAWGTSIAQLLATNGHDVTLWCFEQEVVDSISKNSINKKYLDRVELNKNITPVSDLNQAINSSGIIFLAVPVLFIRNILKQAKSHINKDQKIVILSKGIEDKTLLLLSEVIKDILGFEPKTAVLSGPNFAAQVANKDYSETVIASQDKDLLQEIKKVCENSHFKTVLSDDIIGTQVCGAVKNVISILVGLLDGAGYKENTRAALCTRAFSELAQLVKFLGGKIETVYGPAGLGDTILSFIGEKSRNYEIGASIGSGKLLSELEKENKVLPEGINTLKSLNKLIKERELKLPLFTCLYEAVFLANDCNASNFKCFF